ncbi:Replication factor A [Dissostichus eleginoides]|uniref:Replication factor A n=1 Tax=Dissostichus eleginoides TaxID=100907 RepID=A0AAD9AZM9_DISEL|nr:Replication factor A [Dissostichus eleginoides]
MDQTELETKWRTALSSILDELTDKEFRKLLVNLEKIPQGLKGGVKGGLPRGNMPSVIILHYGTEGSIALIDRQMKILPRLDAAVQQPLKEIKELKKLLKKNKETHPEPQAPQVEDVLGLKLKTRDSQDGKDLWEKSIFDLKSSGIFETEAIVGKVVKKSELLTYDTKTKKGKFFFYLGVADETASVKLMVYGEDLHRQIKEGSSYIFRNLIQDGKYVKVNASSSVSETKPVNVPEEFEREAERLVYPESPLTSIKDIKSSPPQTHVSVEGTVTEIYPVKKVKVEHEEKKMKRFKMRQEAEEISVTMWGEATEQSKDLSVGDVLRLEYMKPKEYFTEVSLNSSQFTKITKVQSVGIQKVTLKIRGIKKATLKETQLEVELDTKLQTLVVASRLLAKTLDFQLKKGFGDDLLKRIPLSVEAEIQGNRIIKMADPENI